MIGIATLFRKLQTVKEFIRQLFKNHRLRNIYDNQDIKEFQTLVKFA